MGKDDISRKRDIVKRRKKRIRNTLRSSYINSTDLKRSLRYHGAVKHRAAATYELRKFLKKRKGK